MIGRYLDLSTAHLTQREACSAAERLARSGPRVIEHEYGLWVHVSQEDSESFESDIQHLHADFPTLLAVIRYARALGADVFWINFDADGARCEHLPVHEW